MSVCQLGPPHWIPMNRQGRQGRQGRQDHFFRMTVVVFKICLSGPNICTRIPLISACCLFIQYFWNGYRIRVTREKPFLSFKGDIWFLLW